MVNVGNFTVKTAREKILWVSGDPILVNGNPLGMIIFLCVLYFTLKLSDHLFGVYYHK